MKRGLILALVLLALTALLFSGAGPFLVEDPQVISVGGGAAGEGSAPAWSLTELRSNIHRKFLFS